MSQVLGAAPPDYRDVVWAPQPGSIIAYLTCPFEEVFLHGPRWTGKSDAMIWDFCRGVGRGWGAAWRGLFFRREYEDLNDIINKCQVYFPRVYGKSVTFTRSPHPVFRWNTGEEFMLRAFDTIEDYGTYHGWSIPWIGWDELPQWPTRDGYLKMKSINKSTHPEISPLSRYRASGNPDGPGRGWVIERFSPLTNHIISDSKDADGKLEKPRVAIQTYLEENQILLEAIPDAIQKIRGSCTTPAEIAAWVHGRWDVTAGGMIDDIWDDKYHFITPFDIPNEWYINRVLDWGSSSPWAEGIFAESNGCDVALRNGRWRSTVPGDLFLIGECYGWNGRANEGSKAVVSEVTKLCIQKEIELGLRGRVNVGPGDVWGTINHVTGATLADDFRKPVWLDNGVEVPGLQWTRPNKGPTSIKDGWEIIRRMLTDAKPRPNQPRENPGLFVFDNCYHWKRTVPTLSRDPKKPDQDHPKGENHLADLTRYRVLEHGRRATYGRVRGMC